MKGKDSVTKQNKMKLEIYYKSHLLKSTIKSPITIKDIILNLKSTIKTIKSNQTFLIFNNNYELLSEDENIIPNEKINKPFQLFLIDSEKEKEKENKQIEIEDLIMKVTGANKKLQNNNNKLPPPNIYENNLNLNRLLQLLQAIEQRNIIEGNVNNYINNNVPVEVNESYLNELKDMGFPEDRARQALITSRNNMNRATEILLDEGGE